jgi:hypothetical protein
VDAVEIADGQGAGRGERRMVKPAKDLHGPIIASSGAARTPIATLGHA